MFFYKISTFIDLKNNNNIFKIYEINHSFLNNKKNQYSICTATHTIFFLTYIGIISSCIFLDTSFFSFWIVLFFHFNLQKFANYEMSVRQKLYKKWILFKINRFENTYIYNLSNSSTFLKEVGLELLSKKEQQFIFESIANHSFSKTHIQILYEALVKKKTLEIKQHFHMPQKSKTKFPQFWK